MITPEERQEIIDAAVEKTLLMIPETIGNLMTKHTYYAKANVAFNKKYPEFKGKADIVASVVEMTEGKNPVEDYEKLLEKAVPEIRKRIATVKNMDVKTVSSTPKRDFQNIDIPQAERPSLHGVL